MWLLGPKYGLWFPSHAGFEHANHLCTLHVQVAGCTPLRGIPGYALAKKLCLLNSLLKHPEQHLGGYMTLYVGLGHMAPENQRNLQTCPPKSGPGPPLANHFF